MKTNLFLLVLVITISQGIYAQSDNTKKSIDFSTLDSSTVFKDATTGACTCIDSISLINKNIDTIANDIHNCIDMQTAIYLTSLKVLSATKSIIGEKKDIKISLDINQNSKEYVNAYRDIESWLRDSCRSLNKAIMSNNLERENSISKNPKAIAEYEKAMKLTGVENFKDAIPYLEKAVKLDPTFAFAWDNLGVCYRKTEQYSKALEAYKTSLKLDPLGELPLQNIPVVYEYMKEYDNALEAYKNILKIHPKDPESFYGAGRVYLYDKMDFEKGLDNMCKAYKLYAELNSPYRVDAEKVIQYIYSEMKKKGKEDAVNKILEENNITGK